MRKITSYLVTLLLANIITIGAFAQNVTISGNVRNSASKEATGAVSVTVKGSEAGTFTDDRGNFRITVKSLPVTLLVSSIGFEMQEITVNKSGDASLASTMSTNSSSSSNFQEFPVAQIQAASTQSAKMDLDGTDSPWGGKYMMRVDKKIGCRG